MLEFATAANWFHLANSSTRKNHIAALDKAEQMYYHLVPGRAEGSKGSNMVLPTTTVSVNRLIPKLSAFIFPIGENINIPDQPISAKKHFRDKLKEIQFRKTVKSWIRRSVIDGTGILYPFWEDAYEYLKENLYFFVSPEEIELAKRKDKEYLSKIFLSSFESSVRGWDFRNGVIRANMHDDYGHLEDYTISFAAENQEITMTVTGTRLVYSGLRVRVVPIRNLFFPVDTPGLDEAEFIIYQQFCSPEYLSGFEISEKEINLARGQQYSEVGPRSPGEGAVSKLGERTEQPPASNAVEMWQVFHRGKITFMLPSVSKVFMEVDLEKEFPRRMDFPRWPFFDARFIEMNERLVFGWSLPLLLFQYQKEMDYLNNLTNDAGDLATALFGAYKSSSYRLGEPPKLKLERNTLFPLDEPDKDLKIFQFNPNVGWAVQKMAMLSQEIERLSSIDEMTLGRGPAQGANRGERTLGGMQMLQGQKQEFYLEVAWDFRQGVNKTMSAMLFLYSRKAPAAILAAANLDRNTLRGSSVLVDADLSSAQQILGRVTSLYQLCRDPLLIQMGIVGPKALSRLVKKLFKAYDEDPDEFGLQVPVADDPMDHIEQLLAGGMPMPSPVDNHRDHISKESKAMQEAGMGANEKFQGHIQFHMTMLEQVQQQPQEALLGKYGGGGKLPIV